jgi:putative addiction module killer protein
MGLKIRTILKKFENLVRILKTQGKDLTLPISRFLGEGLHEMRDMSRGFRIYYTFFRNSLAILPVIGNKSSQDIDIERARNRRKKLIEQRKG